MTDSELTAALSAEFSPVSAVDEAARRNDETGEHAAIISGIGAAGAVVANAAVVALAAADADRDRIVVALQFLLGFTLMSVLFALAGCAHWSQTNAERRRLAVARAVLARAVVVAVPVSGAADEKV